MDEQPIPSRRTWKVIALAAVVVVASTIGTASYVHTVNSAAADRARILDRMCHRQDQVIDVLDVIAIEERSEAIHRDTVEAREAAARLEAKIDQIAASPCADD